MAVRSFGIDLTYIIIILDNLACLLSVLKIKVYLYSMSSLGKIASDICQLAKRILRISISSG